MVSIAGISPAYSAQWTIMVYLAADNDLEEAAIMDFEEMEWVGSTDDVNIIVQFDRIPGHSDADGDWTNTRRYRILHDENAGFHSQLVQNMGEVNMADPRELSAFISWGRENYEADHYALILWNHGGGWQIDEDLPDLPLRDEGLVSLNRGAVRQQLGNPEWDDFGGIENGPDRPPFPSNRGFKMVCGDHTNGGYLYNHQIRQVLEDFPNIDILGFDACLMGMVEVAYEMRGQTSFMVASEEVEWGYGWHWHYLLADVVDNPRISPRDFAIRIAESYGEGEGYNESDQTQSAVDMSQIVSLANSVDTFAEALIDADAWNYILQLGNQTETFYAPTHDRDLRHFAALCQNANINDDVTASAGNVVSMLDDEVVIHNFHGNQHPDAGGLAIYFPLTSGAYDEDYGNGHYGIGFPENTQWDEFLEALHNGGGNGPVDNYEPNDEPRQAYGPLESEQQYSSYISAAGDVDYYLINIGEAGDISIEMTGPEVDFDLFLRYLTEDDELDQLAESRGFASEESIAGRINQPGLYLIAVEGYLDAYSDQPYHLTATFPGARQGTVVLSHDDGEPDIGVYAEDLGDAFCTYFELPELPMRLEGVYLLITHLSFNDEGDGSFYPFVMDLRGELIVEPVLMTPEEVGWLYLDYSDQNIIASSNLLSGIMWDGTNTPCVGADETPSGYDWIWLAEYEEWFSSGWTFYVRLAVSYIEPVSVPGEKIPVLNPEEFRLVSNFPNPFNSSTTLLYDVPEQSSVHIAIFDLMGREVAILLDAEAVIGRHRVSWNAKDASCGLYMVKMRTIDGSKYCKIMLLK